MANLRYVVKVLETYGDGSKYANVAEPMWKEIKTYRKEEDAMDHARRLDKAGHHARVYERDLDDE